MKLGPGGQRGGLRILKAHDLRHESGSLGLEV